MPCKAIVPMGALPLFETCVQTFVSPLLPSEKADYFCCTRPEVAFGGCYPLSLPYGARTFLVSGLSAISRGCPAYSRPHFTLFPPCCQMKMKLRENEAATMYDL